MTGKAHILTALAALAAAVDRDYVAGAAGAG